MKAERLKLPKEEKETIICFNEGNNAASVYTCSRSWQTHLKKLGLKPSMVNDHGGMEFNLNKSWIRKPLPSRRQAKENK